MPTTKPRVAITLSPEDYSVLKDFSEATGQPVSRFISSLIVDITPNLKKALEIVRSAQDVQKVTLEALHSDLASMASSAHEVINLELSKAEAALSTSAAECARTPARERKGGGDRRELQYPLAINKGVRKTTLVAERNNKTTNKPFLALDNTKNKKSKGVSNASSN